MFKQLSVVALLALAVAPVRGQEEVEVTALRGAAQMAADDGKWYFADMTKGQTPSNLKDMGNGLLKLKVAPGQEAVSLHSKELYTGGRFEVRIKSAAVMPGIITAAYLASASGRTGDEAIGQQDELDWEFKGNDPFNVQTNIFQKGVEDLKLIPVGGDSSKSEHTYTLEWSDHRAAFYIDGKQVRQKFLTRPLEPMRISMSVWTTTGGWPGLKKWGGECDWSSRNWQPVEATFQIIQLPTKAVAMD